MSSDKFHRNIRSFLPARVGGRIIEDRLATSRCRSGSLERVRPYINTVLMCSALFWPSVHLRVITVLDILRTVMLPSNRDPVDELFLQFHLMLGCSKYGGVVRSEWRDIPAYGIRKALQLIMPLICSNNKRFLVIFSQSLDDQLLMTIWNVLLSNVHLYVCAFDIIWEKTRLR